MPSPLEIKRQENRERREREQLLQLLPDNLATPKRETVYELVYFSTC